MRVDVIVSCCFQYFLDMLCSHDHMLRFIFGICQQRPRLFVCCACVRLFTSCLFGGAHFIPCAHAAAAAGVRLFMQIFNLYFVQRRSMQDYSITHLIKVFHICHFIFTGRPASHKASNDLGNAFDVAQQIKINK